MALTADELYGLPLGSLVLDEDDDVWEKGSTGLWSVVNRRISPDDYYKDRDSDRIEHYGLQRVLRWGGELAQPEPEPEPESVIEGVWIVWTSSSRSGDINGVWPDEIGALRFVNENGYGHAAFQPFGQVTY